MMEDVSKGSRAVGLIIAGEVELSGISITLKISIMAMNNISNGKGVDGETVLAPGHRVMHGVDEC